MQKSRKKSSSPCPSYKVHVSKPSTDINEAFYNVATQLLATHPDVS